jgi:hypothetical protein
MGSATLWRYRRTTDKSFQLEPFVVADSWYGARNQVRVILQCERPLVEDTGQEPPPPEVIPPPSNGAPPKRKRKRIKPQHKKRARQVKDFKELRKKALKKSRGKKR